MQFSFRGSNNVLHVFSLKFASFLRYYVHKKSHFSKAILWGPIVERKTKEAFCFAKAWGRYNTGTSTTASLAQMVKALNGPDLSLFCPDAGSIHFSKPKISIYLHVFVIESPFLIA